MGLNRQQLSQIYRPVGPKQVIVGRTPDGFNASTFGGSFTLTQAVDLSLPIRGFRFVFKYRVTVGGANFASVFPESVLNAVSRIFIQGTNSRQKGNVVLWDADLATLFAIQQFFSDDLNASLNINGVEQVRPSTPYAILSALTTTVGTYDVRIAIDLPSYPFECPPGARPQFLIRDAEWADTLQIQCFFGTQAGGGATGFLGVSGGSTTVAFSGYGGGGSPTCDIYSLPMIMGLDLKDQFIPGFIVRVSQPITNVLQTAGPQNTVLWNLQKQPTIRTYHKFGTSTFPNGNPAFATLSDSNVSTLALVIGANRFVRNSVDIFAHKQETTEEYGTSPIQGYSVFDFIPSGNPDSDYPGDLVGQGTTFQIQGTVAGVSNAAGILVQEQALYSAEGPLYSF